MKNGMLKNSIGYKNRITRRLSSLLLVVCMTIGTLLSVFLSLPMEAEAAYADGVYALNIVTGLRGGSGVGYFKIEYTDGSGVHRTQIIDAKNTSNSITVTEDASAAKRRSIASSLGMTLSAGGAGSSRLGSYNEDTYFFTLPKVGGQQLTIGSVTEISVIMLGSTSSERWNCQRMTLYQVQSTPVAKMYGFYSSNLYYQYQRKQLATMVPKNTSTGAVFQANEAATNYVFHVVSPDGDFYRVLAGTTNPGYSLSTVQQVATGGRGDEFIFQINIADTFGGGLEGLANSATTATSIGGGQIPECLFLTVFYEDTYSENRSVTMPVLYSTLGNALELNAITVNSNIADLAGQGESLAFSAALPDLKTIKEMQLTYGNQGAQNFTAASLAYNSNQTAILNNMNATSDSISIESIAIYNGAESTISYTYQNSSMLVPVISGTPYKCYTTSTASGNSVQFGGTLGVSSSNLQDYSSNTVLVHDKNVTDKYLITVQTDEMDLAASTSDIRMRLEYTDQNGDEKTSPEFNMLNLARDFYGYWPGVNGTNTTDAMGYYYGISAGKSLSFVITLQGVDEFTGVSFNNTGTDDWQVNSLKIEEVTSIGKRTSTWDSSSSSKLYSTNRYYTRVVNGRNMDVNETENEEDADGNGSESDTTSSTLAKTLIDSSNTVLIRAGNTTDYSLSGSDVIRISDNDQNIIKSNTFLLNYEDALKNFGFDKVRKTYSVSVEVPKDQQSILGYGDSGSVNQFFFQLVFEDGYSAYVLANQQLGGDGFRSGTISSFLVSTNDDFGNLKKINIISDSTAEGSDVYDKLNIKSITVTEKGSSYQTPSWVFNNIGWVDIDYQDDGDSAAQVERDNGRIVHTYDVDTTTQSVQIQFSLHNYHTYGKISNGVEEVQTVQSEGLSPNPPMLSSSGTNVATTTATNEQFDGTIDLFTVTYIDVYNETQTKPISVMTELYNFNELSTGGADTLYMDKESMARKGTTDRFTTELPNVAVIKSVTMKVSRKDDTPTYYNLDSISVGLVNGDTSAKFVNKRNERQLNAKIDEWTTTNTNGQAISFDLSTNKSAEKTISFNEVNVSDAIIDASQGEASNDKVNLFLTLDETTPIRDDVNMRVEVMFANAEGKKYVSEGVMERRENGYYLYGLSISNLKNFESIELTAETANGEVTEYKVDKMIVQKIRNDVVLDVFDATFDGQNALTGATSSNFNAHSSEGVKQTVTLGFTAGTEDVVLSKGTKDISIALLYTTTYDPAHSVQSAYLTLAGSGVGHIDAGTLADIDFYIPDLEDVQAIVIQKVGKFGAYIDSAVVGNYLVQTYTEGENTVTDSRVLGWFSFNGMSTPFEVSQTANMMNQNRTTTYDAAGAVNILELQIETAPPQTDKESGITLPVRATLNYLDYQNQAQTYVVTDLNDFLESGNFTAGSTAKIRLLVPNLNTITSLTLEPTLDSQTINESYSWMIRNVRLNYSVNNRLISRSKGSEDGTLITITKGTPGVINFGSTTLSLLVNGEAASTSRYVFTQEQAKSDMQLTYTLDGSVGDVYYRIDEIDSSGNVLVTGTPAKAEATTSLQTSVLAAAAEEASKYYRVTAYLGNDTSVAVYFEMEIQAKVKENDSGAWWTVPVLTF